LVDNNGHPVLYDPGGDYSVPGSSHPDDDTFYDEEAVLGPYIAADLHSGQSVDIIEFISRKIKTPVSTLNKKKCVAKS
jgi:hypothetical protein